MSRRAPLAAALSRGHPVVALLLRRSSRTAAGGAARPQHGWLVSHSAGTPHPASQLPSGRGNSCRTPSPDLAAVQVASLLERTDFLGRQEGILPASDFGGAT